MSENGKENRTLRVVAVFHARVKAHSGKGTVTALVQGQEGHRLYGATNLVNAKLLPDQHHGRFVDAGTLADLLKVKVVSGKVKCIAFLAEHKVSGVSPDHILDDAPSTGRRSTRGLSLTAF